MRLWPVVVLLSAASVAAQRPLTFSVDAGYVRVPVTVLDEQGGNQLGLTRYDFRLFDEGSEQPIVNFVLDKTPISVALLVDASGSVRAEIDELKATALRFARTFGPEDQIAVFGFSDEVRLLQNWTRSRDRVRKALKKVEKGYRTALYDSLITIAAEHLPPDSSKKAIIVMTDGLDNESRQSYEAALDELIESNTALYIISRTRMLRSQVEDSSRVEFLNRVMKNVLDDGEDFVDVYFRTKERSLDRLAEASGGRVLYPERLEDLGDSYLEVARELKNQYLLTFLPQTESEVEFRSIRVECLRPVGRMFYRQRYHVR